MLQSVNLSLFFPLKDHYDFGMRAVKTVISAAGNLKRENPNMNEVPLFIFRVCVCVCVCAP